MEFKLIEIPVSGLNLCAAECEASVWGHPVPAELLKENIAFWSSQSDPLLILACDATSKVIGFRYAHALPPENGARILYDQNGGVTPSCRRHGIGRALLREQHRIAKERGYSKIRTGCAIPMKAMIILNLQEGFSIVDLYQDAKFNVKVLAFEKNLTAPDPILFARPRRSN